MYRGDRDISTYVYQIKSSDSISNIGGSLYDTKGRKVDELVPDSMPQNRIFICCTI